MTSMEKFHWLDQNPELPNFVFATLRFAVRIDPEIARQSFAIVLRRQALAAVEPVQIGGRWQWKTIPDIQFDGDRFFSSAYLNDDGSKSPGSLDPSASGNGYTSYFLSVTNASKSKSPSDGSWPSDVASEIRFHSHHAASDGVASIGIINDWLTTYNNLLAGESAEDGLIELDSSSFQSRGVLGLLSWNYLRGLPQQAIALFGAAKFIFRTTKTIASETPSTENSAAYPAIKGAWVDAATLKTDRSRSSNHQVGFTAWCLAKCFVAIKSWNQHRESEFDETRSTRAESGQSAARSKTTSIWRILLPMSIRTAADRAAVAANRTAIVQIDRQPPDAGVDLIHFCQSIDSEIKFIRRWQLEKIFLIAIRLASISNSWLAKMATNPVSRGGGCFYSLGPTVQASDDPSESTNDVRGKPSVCTADRF